MENNLSLTGLDFTEILEQSFLKSYKETLEVIWRELLRLNSYLFILEKLINFPVSANYLFLGLDKQNFLTLVNISFTESSLLIITKLITDEGKDNLLIKKFKDRVIQNIKRQYKEAFFRSLKENKFDETLKQLKKQVKDIKDIRNNNIAHLLVDENFRLKDPTDKISWQKINQVSIEVNKLFDLLCFNCKYLHLPLDYDPKVQYPVGTDSRPDIEYFLDLIIQDSYLYKMPDESQYWNIIKEKLSPNILNILNKYRRKFGKPEV